MLINIFLTNYKDIIQTSNCANVEMS